MHTRPQTADIARRLSWEDLWKSLVRSDGTWVDELVGRLFWVGESWLKILTIEIHIIRLEILSSEIHEILGWAQAGQVAIVECVLVDVTVVHVDSQGIRDGSLRNAGLLTIEIVVVTGTAEGWLLRWQRRRGVGDSSGRELLLLSAWRDRGRVV